MTQNEIKAVIRAKLDGKTIQVSECWQWTDMHENDWNFNSGPCSTSGDYRHFRIKPTVPEPDTCNLCGSPLLESGCCTSDGICPNGWRGMIASIRSITSRLGNFPKVKEAQQAGIEFDRLIDKFWSAKPEPGPVPWDDRDIYEHLGCVLRFNKHTFLLINVFDYPWHDCEWKRPGEDDNAFRPCCRS